MSNTTIIYISVGAAVFVSIVAWIAFILIPAWTSYQRLWARLAAAVMSVYILGAFVLLGSLIGAAVLYFGGQQL